MKIIAAFDSFKDCSDAAEICRLFAEGWRSRRPGDRIVAIPLSDGGEGFTAAAARMLRAEVSAVTVPGPAGENTEAAYAVSGSLACTDMAQAAGLELVPPGRRSAMRATSYGFGLLLRHIASLGVREIICGIGGSATSDGGIGCAQALGWRFFDREGRLIPPGGGAADCGRAASMIPPEKPFPARIRAACDVTNPLCGPRGAARVYSPQKGATPEEAAAIDGFLAGWAALWRDPGEEPGDGAAGGMGFFLRRGLNAELLPGARLLLEMADFDAEVRDADWIVTGEGSSDRQTLSGKLPFIVAEEAAARHIPCVLLSGRIADCELLREHFTAIWSLASGPCTLEEAIRSTPENLFRAGANLAGMIWESKNRKETMNPEIVSLLQTHHQEQLLAFASTLPPEGRERLAAQIRAIDFSAMDELIRDYVLARPETPIPPDLAPAPYFPAVPADEAQAEYYRRAEAEGRSILRDGRAALLTVAGGQGTRLGFDGPKGTYPIGPVTGRTLFAYFAEAIARAGEKYGRDFLWFIMTSELNNAATVEFFRANGFFGLREDNVRFFVQGTMPAIGYDGKLLLGAPDSLALSPDGHGGTLLALRRSGALDRMKAAGVEYISYFQVDNPLVPVVNPLFLGLHALEQSEMSAIMLSKTGPYEKLGNFCVSGGRTRIIEYSDLPASLAESRNPDGTLRFIAGSPAIHVLNRSFVERLTAGGKLSLPWHRADKKVPFVNEKGESVKPETPNAVKLESFIFDALPLAEKTMILEADRLEQFGPTKNATGVDSAESCRELLIARDRRRLAAAGIPAPEGKIEISPRLAMDAEDVKALAGRRDLFRKCGDGYVAERER